MGTCRAIGANLHTMLNDLSCQRFGVFDRTWTGTRQTEIERVDPKSFHQMKDRNFFLDRRIAHRGRLQTIT